MDEAFEHIAQRASELAALRPIVEEVAGTLAQTFQSLSESDFIDGASYYREFIARGACREALIRCAILLDQNLFYLETLGVLALTRYIFEILVWLKVLDQDPDQAFEFYRQLVEAQIQHIESQKEQLRTEAEFFKVLDNEDGIPEDLMKDLTLDTNAIASGDFARRIHEHTAKVDHRARRRFSLYARDAKTNGYGFQAYLIETKAIPAAQLALDAIKADAADSEAKIGKETLDRITTNSKGSRLRRNWRDRAASVGMGQQYDFIYSYTSRLLHALPVSFFTHQKNLEPREMETFLEFVYVSMLDIIDLGRKLTKAPVKGLRIFDLDPQMAVGSARRGCYQVTEHCASCAAPRRSQWAELTQSARIRISGLDSATGQCDRGDEVASAS